MAVVVFFLFLTSGILKQCKVQNRFGFAVSTPDLGGRFHNKFEPAVIYSIDKDGAFDKAGFKTGDVLLSSEYRWLQNYLDSFDQPSGTKIYIESVPDGMSAKSWKELQKMRRATREVIAP